VYTQSAHRWLSHPPGSRLPLLSARHAVTSVALTRWRHPYTVAHNRFQRTTHLATRPRKDERMSWPGWLTCRGPFTNNSGRSSAGQEKFAGRRLRRAVPRHRLNTYGGRAQRSGTVSRISSWTSQSALTLSDVCRRRICLRDTSACRALEVDNFMRYINLLTYLLLPPCHRARCNSAAAAAERLRCV